MQWINVEDRLPDSYIFVLTYSKMLATNEPCPITIARWNNEKWETLCNEEENNACACGDLFWATASNEITHWMPLPKPPKLNCFLHPLHNCVIDGKHFQYGPAITDCMEDDNGRLWVDNNEYGNQVNFCPKCGYEAKKKIGE